jgi:hypothetical protein
LILDRRNYKKAGDCGGMIMSNDFDGQERGEVKGREETLKKCYNEKKRLRAFE